MKNIDSATENLILRLAYNASNVTGYRRAIHYCYPSSPMAKVLGNWGYYNVATRTTSEGKVIDLHYPQVYRSHDDAHDAIEAHFVLNYLEYDKYSQRHPSLV